ncbi:cytidine deaminase [Porphyromonas endodontalis]|uniref:cytidine deaminase n=1 Tax=Porphyromonas endodontalis TaxID=28124 RepID=UPI003606492D
MHTLSIPYERIQRKYFDATLLRLEEAAVEAARNAYAPYSRFRVGAALLLSNGVVVVGSNQENAAYPSGLCAERTALFAAGAQYPNEAVGILLLVAFSEEDRVESITPCGACRQVLMETSSRHQKPFKVIMVGKEQALVLHDNRGLLPFAFDGSDLPD